MWIELIAPPAPMAIAVAAIETLSGPQVVAVMIAEGIPSRGEDR